MWRHIAKGASCQYRGTSLLYLEFLGMSMQNLEFLTFRQISQREIVEIVKNKQGV